MLKKAFVLGLASLAGLPIHLFPHPPHLDWANVAMALAAFGCLAIGLSRRP